MNISGLLFRLASGITVVLFLVIGYGAGFIFPPVPLSKDPVSIKRGMNGEEISNILKEKHIIRSKTLFVWTIYLSGAENRLAAGKFVFSEPMSFFSVLKELSGVQKETIILIIEGMTAQDIKELLARNNMDAAATFLDHVNKYRNSEFPFLANIPSLPSVEGFLFPDTYRFYEFVDADEVITTLIENFATKIKPLEKDLAAQKRSLYDIVTLASILEKEVRTPEDKAVVAGIYLKRLQQKIPLQADATLAYETGKTSSELTLEDLRSTSPFNTYVHLGLPPSPIGNPGIDSIRAALYPTSSPYMFYLSDKQGVTHFARTFDEHKKNKIKYLSN